VGRFVRHKRDERAILGLIEDNRAALSAVETDPEASIPVVTLHKVLTQLAMRFTAGSTLKRSSYALGSSPAAPPATYPPALS
jgi:hypothetical protein